MIDKTVRDKEMESEGADAALEVAVANFNKKAKQGVEAAEVRIRCLYDCDCTVVGGTDPIPPFGTVTGVAAYGVGTVI